MGRRIDRFVLTTLLAGALYIFFTNAFRSIPVAAAAAFVSMAILKKLSSKLPRERFGRKRRDLADAHAECESLSLGQKEDAEIRIREILLKAYGKLPDGTQLRIILRHPAGTKLSADDIAEIYRELRGCSKALIVSTANADTGAYTLAEKLEEPKLRLIDGAQLAKLIAVHDPRPSASKPAKRKSFSAFKAAAAKVKTGKCVGTAVMMLILFSLNGALAYLIGALIMLFLAGVSIKKRRIPEELFPASTA